MGEKEGVCVCGTVCVRVDEQDSVCECVWMSRERVGETAKERESQRVMTESPA